PCTAGSLEIAGRLVQYALDPAILTAPDIDEQCVDHSGAFILLDGHRSLAGDYGHLAIDPYVHVSLVPADILAGTDELQKGLLGVDLAIAMGEAKVRREELGECRDVRFDQCLATLTLEIENSGLADRRDCTHRFLLSQDPLTSASQSCLVSTWAS